MPVPQIPITRKITTTAATYCSMAPLRRTMPCLTATVKLLRARRCDVFINHRSVDTGRTVAGLLFDRLAQLNLQPSLGDRAGEPEHCIRDCAVGVAIFSPRYFESLLCLQELALLVEAKKKLVPIFCDLKPSEILGAIDGRPDPPETLERFRRALQEAKHTVGITFDSQSGNWSELITRIADVVLKNTRDI